MLDKCLLEHLEMELIGAQISAPPGYGHTLSVGWDQL